MSHTLNSDEFQVNFQVLRGYTNFDILARDQIGDLLLILQPFT